MSQRYSEIRVPVVIVTGDKDKIVSANENAYRLHSKVAGSQLIELKNTGHEIPQTHPESIYSSVSLISHSLSVAWDQVLTRQDLGSLLHTPTIVPANGHF